MQLCKRLGPGHRTCSFLRRWVEVSLRRAKAESIAQAKKIDKTMLVVANQFEQPGNAVPGNEVSQHTRRKLNSQAVQTTRVDHLRCTRVIPLQLLRGYP